MGFLDKIGNGFKKVTETTKNLAEQQAKKIRYRNEVRKLKIQLLMRFTKDQLEQLAAIYHISLYIYPDPLSDRAVRLRSKVDIAEHLADKLYYNDVLEAAHRFKINYSDIDSERQRLYESLIGVKESQRSITHEKGIIPQRVSENKGATQEIQQVTQDPYLTAMWQLREILIHEFEPQPVRDELEFKSQILQYLIAKLGRENVAQEVMMGSRKVDIVLWRSVAVELKLARGQQSLTNLIGEVVKLKRAGVPYVMSIILDVGRYPNLHQDIQDINELGVMTVVLKGRMKEPKKKKVTVEFK